MESSDANPYSSPEATVPEPADAVRLPLGRVLLGLLLIPVVTGAAGLLSWPLHNAISYAIGLLTHGYGFFDVNVEMALQNAWGLGLFGGINAVVVGLPLAYFSWRSGRLKPKRLLWTGGLLAIAWFTVFLGLSLPAMLESNWQIVGTDSVSINTTLGILQTIITLLLLMPLPLFAGFAAYAWWVRRLGRLVGGAG